MSKLDKAAVAVMNALETAHLAGHGVTDTDLRNALRPFFETAIAASISGSVVVTDHATYLYYEEMNKSPINEGQNVVNTGSKRWDHAK